MAGTRGYRLLGVAQAGGLADAVRGQEVLFLLEEGGELLLACAFDTPLQRFFCRLRSIGRNGRVFPRSARRVFGAG